MQSFIAYASLATLGVFLAWAASTESPAAARTRAESARAASTRSPRYKRCCSIRDARTATSRATRRCSSTTDAPCAERPARPRGQGSLRASRAPLATTRRTRPQLRRAQCLPGAPNWHLPPPTRRWCSSTSRPPSSAPSSRIPAEDERQGPPRDAQAHRGGQARALGLGSRRRSRARRHPARRVRRGLQEVDGRRGSLPAEVTAGARPPGARAERA